MRDEADPALFERWARGWTLTRGVTPPAEIPGGWQIEANRPDHRWRFLYPRLCAEAAEQARAVLPDPFALKIAATGERVAAMLPDDYVLDATTCMMTAAPTHADVALPAGYRLVRTAITAEVTHVAVTAADGAAAASGWLAVIDDVATFDRIVTVEAHWRRGLGRAVMAALGEAANAATARRWMLAATAAGRALYERIGWEMHASYTTAQRRSQAPGG